MQIKKFLGPTLKEAIEKMKQQLGDEAIVLSTKVLEGNLKLGQKKLFEITAGIDNDFSETKPRNITKEKEDINFDRELQKLSQKIYDTKKKGTHRNPTLELLKNIKQKNITTQPLLDLKEIEDLLIQRDIDSFNVKTIIEQLQNYKAFLNEENIDNYVISTISSMVKTEKFELNKKDRPYIISFVGSTGVGKTTCIAKLAVISKILHNLDIGLISIDTYRLGALDQLKIFSEVSNIDFIAAYDPSDLQKGIEKFKKKDIIFIDTMGRSQKNVTLLKEIKKFLDTIKINDTYLVLNATSTSKNMIDVADKFKLFNYSGFVFSKLDEAVSFGGILNVVTKFNIPIKYLTNGQVIPDDIVSADSEFVANLIYTGKVSQ